MRFPQLVIALLLLFGSVNADQNWEGWAGPGDQTKWPSPSYTPKVVDVDVAIIGGGSGGVHAAIQLKDAGASLMVIEKKDRSAATQRRTPTLAPVSSVTLVLPFLRTQIWSNDTSPASECPLSPTPWKPQAQDMTSPWEFLSRPQMTSRRSFKLLCKLTPRMC